MFLSLRKLVLMVQNIQTIENLECLPNLEELWIVDCQLTAITGLDKNINLTHLYLYVFLASRSWSLSLFPHGDTGKEIAFPRWKILHICVLFKLYGLVIIVCCWIADQCV